jgi:chromosome segregation ATPase
MKTSIESESEEVNKLRIDLTQCTSQISDLTLQLKNSKKEIQTLKFKEEEYESLSLKLNSTVEEVIKLSDKNKQLALHKDSSNPQAVMKHYKELQS